jgi:hypothetical protein
LYYFHRKLKIKKNPKQPTFSGFLGVFFLLGFLGGFLLPTLHEGGDERGAGAPGRDHRQRHH